MTNAFNASAHEGFADQDGVASAVEHALGVGALLETAFADEDDVFGHFLAQLLGGREVDFEGVEIAVIDADEFRAEFEGAIQLLAGVNFDECIQLKGLGFLEESFERWLVERGNNEENCIGARHAGFPNLCLVDDEILAQARQRGLRADAREVPEASLKKLL